MGRAWASPTDPPVVPSTTAPPARDEFYLEIPTFNDFADIVEPELYRPLPADWWVGGTDVIGSTAEIERGRYKAVNMAGATAIAAVANALDGRAFPFVFGGDGATFAVPAADVDAARDALARTVAFSREELKLGLRAALAPVALVRGAGQDVRVARYAASADVSYAMFTGGGLAWFEDATKRGLFGVPPAKPGERPNLAGLSCRWEEMPARRGLILSLIVIPSADADPAAARALLRDVVALCGQADRPVTDAALRMRWPPSGLAMEAKTLSASGMSIGRSYLSALWRSLVAFTFMKFRLRAGAFDAITYRRATVANADDRKYGDGLRATVDCTPELARRIKVRLEDARDTAVWGLHEQTSSLMTCFVPGVTRDDHIHFIDGANGGYAAAAQSLKAASDVRA